MGLEAWNVPNPFDPSMDGPTAIHFNLPEAAYVTVKVYDLAGELVNTLRGGRHFPVGDCEVTWDGKTDNGTPVSTGVYLVRVFAEGESGESADAVVKVAIVQK
jgi:flagellar hook assembly protein FlgD